MFRFVSILGPRYTHGHVIDFVRQLLERPATSCAILGDGAQRKSYLHVARLRRRDRRSRSAHEPQFEVFNLGVDDYCTVTESAGWICERLGVEPEVRVHAAATAAGSATTRSSTSTPRASAPTGWEPRVRRSGRRSSRTVDYLVDHRWILDGPIAAG